MPTPSENHPSRPTSPPPPYGFSTCPEDSQQSLRPPRPAQSGAHGRTDVESRRGSSPDEASRTSSEQGASVDLRPREEENSTHDGETPAGAASRATTMSPVPRSSTTAETSPVPSGSDGDSVKPHEAPEVDGPLPKGDVALTKSCLLREYVPNSEGQDIDSQDGAFDEEESFLPTMGPDVPSIRSIPISPSSYLRPGSRFHGTQQSERQVYDVQVEIKHVDMRESFLCGYLRIQGLTEDHPTLTTYFEGEIIGTKYNFFTQHDEWGANTKVDLSHWSKFPAFRPFQKQARKGPVAIADPSQREHLFMRWKEHFLVPDHRVRTISGASFEGFYYICFNQVKGEVSGIYFHARSEKFQQLELKHVRDKGCFNAQEFR